MQLLINGQQSLEQQDFDPAPVVKLFTPDLADAMSRWPGIAVFGCVAFKYQPEEPDPPAAAVVAQGPGMHPTTSNSGTGQALDVAKIEAKSRGVGGRLHIASGMTPVNVGHYAPFVSDILVSTGMSHDAHRFGRSLLVAFLAETGRAVCDRDNGSILT